MFIPANCPAEVRLVIEITYAGPKQVFRFVRQAYRMKMKRYVNPEQQALVSKTFKKLRCFTQNILSLRIVLLLIIIKGKNDIKSISYKNIGNK